VTRLHGGDTDAFDELYRRYSQRVSAYLHRMVGDDCLCQDLLQEVFLRIIEKGRSFDPRRPFPRWLFAIAHNLSCSELRRRGVRRQATDAVGVETRHLAESRQAPAPEEALDTERFTRRLAEELDHLDPERRSAFLLRHAEGFSIADISAVLGCPEGTVKSRLFYATRQLAERLQPFDPSTEPEPAVGGPP
jgi:RNA polymerase sigma-70 factor (ECF subfamily)